MSLLDKAGTLASFARLAISVARHDTGRPSPVPENPKFMSARQAAALVGDGAVVAASGLGAHQRASLLYWALRDRFVAEGRPRRLTLVNVGGHGGRGLLPGTLDELAQPGLCARLISSHFETCHGFLALAAAGRCELQTLPLGVLALLYDEQRRGRTALLSRVGVGTYLDPRTRRGAAGGEPLISAAGDQLRYHLPPIDVALLNLPAADRRGNLYCRDSAMLGDGRELAGAARRHGGLVIATVGRLVEASDDRPFLPAGLVDAIVCHPDTEQTAGYPHRRPWKAITLGAGADVGRALEQARFVRRLGELAGGMARRTALDEAVYRLAASTLLAHVRRGASVAIGTGHPEEIARVVFEHGRLDDLTFQVETGVVGGLPAPGAYFGAAFAPREMLSTAAFFRRCNRRLDAVCLGALEVDGRGDVNVSRRGRGARAYIGPGGFMDFTEAARTIVFVSGWMRDGAMRAAGGAVRIERHGRPKFVARVRQVTFDARRALRAGKQVFYVTPVGLFRLTRRGLLLAAVMPGIDVRADIVDRVPARIVLPAGGPAVLPSSLVTGRGFALEKPGRLSGAEQPEKPGGRRSVGAR